MRSTTTATDAPSHPSLTDSCTADSDPGAAYTYTNTHPSDTHVDLSASNCDSYPAYANTRPPDACADSDTSHTDPGPPYRYLDRGPATSAAPGVHNGAAGGE